MQSNANRVFLLISVLVCFTLKSKSKAISNVCVLIIDHLLTAKIKARAGDVTP